MSAHVNASATERDDNLAVLAALSLMSEERWTLENIARALGRPIEWLRVEIERTLAEDIPDGAAH